MDLLRYSFDLYNLVFCSFLSLNCTCCYYKLSKLNIVRDLNIIVYYFLRENQMRIRELVPNMIQLSEVTLLPLCNILLRKLHQQFVYFAKQLFKVRLSTSIVLILIIKKVIAQLAVGKQVK